jgi:hypothetical protein
MTRKWNAGLGLMIAAVAAALWLGLRASGSQTTTPQTTKIASLKGWSPASLASFSNEWYLWLNNHEMLHFRGDQRHGFSAVSYNTKTRKEQPEPNLSRLQKGYLFSASPDGQWILWDTRPYDNPPKVMAATRRADGKTIYWHSIQYQMRGCFWLPDSRRWVNIADVSTGQVKNGQRVLARRLVIHSLDHPGFQAYAIPNATGNEDLMGVTSQGKSIVTDALVVSSGEAGQAPSTALLSEISMIDSRATARSILVPFPALPPRAGGTFSLSPEGDRLLFSSVTTLPPSLLSRGKGSLHRPAPAGMTAKDIWICHLDGSAPAYLGRWASSDMWYFLWNPDGRHITLHMHRTLYSVPVP